MGPPSDARVVVLHGLRLKGFVPSDAVDDTLGFDNAHAVDELTVLVAEGLVHRRDGRVSGFSLTAAGRSEHRQVLAEELDRHGMRRAIEQCYRRFLEHNDRLLDLCTRWQLREVDGSSVANDHRDEGYDGGIVDSLAALDDRIQPVCAELGEALGRMARYGPGLRHARERVQAGDAGFFTAPGLLSYHSLWFELHEDLLATLGLERTGKT